MSSMLMHQIVPAGARTWLIARERARAAAAAVVKPITSDDIPSAGGPPKDVATRIRPYLSALVSSELNAEASEAELEHIVSSLLVVAHHPLVAKSDAGVWIDFFSRSRTAGPDDFVPAQLDELLDLIWRDASISPSSSQESSPLFVEAAYRAATTLALVAPEAVVPRLFAQFQDDLSPQHVSFIGSLEYGVWATPEGTPFVDVLGQKKAGSAAKAPVGKKNSKEHQDALWEQELREALARKKPVAATLSKQDRVALEKQLEIEGEIRRRMAESLARLKRGFALLLCLVNSQAELVKEYLATMVSDVLRVVTSKPATLVADEAFATYQVRAEGV